MVGVGRVTSVEATVIGLEIVWLAELRQNEIPPAMDLMM